jgi:hypothetical protein
MTTNVIPLRSKIERWAARIRETQAASVDGIIEVGRQLLQAKADCDHGEWGELTGRTTGKSLLPFGWKTAQRLMRIAENRALSNGTHGTHLPASWRTLAVLAALDPDDIEAAIADGKIHPDMERKDAEALVRGTHVPESEVIAALGKANAENPLWAAVIDMPVPALRVEFVESIDPSRYATVSEIAQTIKMPALTAEQQQRVDAIQQRMSDELQAFCDERREQDEAVDRMRSAGLINPGPDRTATDAFGQEVLAVLRGLARRIERSKIPPTLSAPENIDELRQCLAAIGGVFN